MCSTIKCFSDLNTPHKCGNDGGFVCTIYFICIPTDTHTKTQLSPIHTQPEKHLAPYILRSGKERIVTRVSFWWNIEIEWNSEAFGASWNLFQTPVTLKIAPSNPTKIGKDEKYNDCMMKNKKNKRGKYCVISFLFFSLVRKTMQKQKIPCTGSMFYFLFRCFCYIKWMSLVELLVLKIHWICLIKDKNK